MHYIIIGLVIALLAAVGYGQYQRAAAIGAEAERAALTRTVDGLNASITKMNQMADQLSATSRVFARQAQAINEETGRVIEEIRNAEPVIVEVPGEPQVITRNSCWFPESERRRVQDLFRSTGSGTETSPAR